MKTYYIYILSNKYNNVLYVGVTNDLPRRVLEHKQKQIKGFTHKYNCTKLVYYDTTDDVSAAITREKELKNWHREWKENLINEFNPKWEDLTIKEELLGDAETSSA